MDYILILFIACILYKSHLNLNDEYLDYMDRESTIPLRGIFAILIIFHHISQRTSCGDIFKTLSYFGFLNVSIFFTLSGYGLLYQYKNKGKKYLDDFLSKRFTSILIPYVIISFLYFILRNVLDIKTNVKDVFLGLINGAPIVSFSWYVLALCYFYLLFFISCKLFNKNLHLLLSVFWGTCLYCLFCYLKGFNTWWYNSIFSFLFGLLCYFYKVKPNFKLQKLNIYLKILIIFFSFIFCFGACHLLNIKVLRLFFEEASSCLFSLLVLMICRKIKVNNKLLNYLGTRSYEIYLVQEIPILIFRSKNLLFTNNDIIYSLLIIFISIIFAEVLYRLDSFLIDKFKIILDKKKFNSTMTNQLT